MKKRLVLLAGYFLLAPFFILSLISYQSSLHKRALAANVLGASNIVVSFSTVSVSLLEPEIQERVRDMRIDVLKAFFTRYESPLAKYAAEIVDNADKYGLDYRLLPAIAMQESTLCLKAPKDSNNCWGFGIYGKNKTAFPSYSEAIIAISKTIANDYHARGLVEPIQIMSKYTPSNDGEWAANVSYVMDRISPSL